MNPGVRKDAPVQILFLQGGGAGVHDGWDDHLVGSLRDGLGPDAEIRYPRLPAEDDPSYAAWSPAVRAELAALRDDAAVVAHSISAPVLLATLAAHPRPLGMIVLLAAPYVGEGGWPSDEYALPPDLGARLPPDVPVHVFHGDADDTAPPAHADLYAAAIPQATIHRLPNRDHQLNDDLTEVAILIRSSGEGG
jgi:pimeloyl-ACP methyl ester carboxylesterase